MNRLRVVIVAAALLVAACRSLRHDPLDFIGPTAPVVTASATPAELKVNWVEGLPVVEVFIDGHGPWNFLLDSGASDYLIDQRAADEMKLERADLSSDGTGVEVHDGTSGKVFIRQAVRIHEFRSGPLVDCETGAFVSDLSFCEKPLGARIDGLLPAAAFHDALLTLDFAGRSATVAAGELPPADGSDVLSLVDLEEHGIAFIRLEIGGGPCPVLIDSGNRLTLAVPSRLQAKLRFHIGPNVIAPTGGIGGAVPTLFRPLDGTIALGRHRIVDPYIALIGWDRAIAGVGLLREFRVTFDFSHSRVRFERAGSEPIR